MKLAKTIILAISLAAGGCSVLEYRPLGKETLKNAQGHVIGYTERLCDCARGEEIDRVVLFVPDLRSRGTNARNPGLTIVFRPREAERIALAQVTIEEIKQHLQLAH